ncbi:MAG: NADH-quinone oxidoreductase subunit C [Bacteroidia bacterium]|nr:NADH-quinone oxidoreductase subunit C [Bacteroidia bacterium]MCX7652324.1 NADH-quinone oxidoreductase subunit C [Bacteroidia bacterium]MDW8417654.1 NADH-quinone oxidoreductase subunit C [Bacteroidia bacterium]
MSALSLLREALASEALEVREHAGELTFIVEHSRLKSFLRLLKEKYDFDYLVDIGATDHFVEGLRFEIVYNIVSLSQRLRLRVKARLPEASPTVETVSDLWPSAAWHEREAYDMMGIKFEGHPDLRRMYLPEDFEYYPLRKEFPLLGIPGTLPLPPKEPPKPYV